MVMDRISRRRLLETGLMSLALPLLPACAHRPEPVRFPRIGFLIGSTFPTMVAAFHDELRRLGYRNGENIVVETRLSRPNSTDLQDHLAEFARLDLDLIVGAALPQALAIRQVMPTIPMVVGTAPGLVSNGFARSLERPGGHVTGMDELPPGLTGRRLRLLKEAAPAVSRVGLLSTTPGRGGHEVQLADAERAAGDLAITVKPYRAANLAELETALRAMPRARRAVRRRAPHAGHVSVEAIRGGWRPHGLCARPG
jgi:putative tryptophan/tyrosine transport system substrate-binding protein